MSVGAQGWYLTVPDDGAALLQNLRQHGLRPGDRLRIRLIEDSSPTGGSSVGSVGPVGTGGDTGSDLTGEVRREGSPPRDT
jgi:hypothetical protein